MTESEVKRAFLNELEHNANVSKSCIAVGLPRRTAYEWRDADPGFAEEWAKATEYGTDSLEDEAVRRAHEGVVRPVYQGKEHVGNVREYSDTLLIFMLKARRPGKFKDRIANEHSGIDGKPIQYEDTTTVGDEIEQLKRELIRESVISRSGSGNGSVGGNGSHLPKNGSP